MRFYEYDELFEEDFRHIGERYEGDIYYCGRYKCDDNVEEFMVNHYRYITKNGQRLVEKAEFCKYFPTGHWCYEDFEGNVHFYYNNHSKIRTERPLKYLWGYINGYFLGKDDLGRPHLFIGEKEVTEGVDCQQVTVYDNNDWAYEDYGGVWHLFRNGEHFQEIYPAKKVCSFDNGDWAYEDRKNRWHLFRDNIEFQYDKVVDLFGYDNGAHYYVNEESEEKKISADMSFHKVTNSYVLSNKYLKIHSLAMFLNATVIKNDVVLTFVESKYGNYDYREFSIIKDGASMPINSIYLKTLEKNGEIIHILEIK